jgi:hypothetical protein
MQQVHRGLGCSAAAAIDGAMRVLLGAGWCGYVGKGSRWTAAAMGTLGHTRARDEGACVLVCRYSLDGLGCPGGVALDVTRCNQLVGACAGSAAVDCGSTLGHRGASGT